MIRQVQILNRDGTNVKCNELSVCGSKSIRYISGIANQTGTEEKNKESLNYVIYHTCAHLQSIKSKRRDIPVSNQDMIKVKSDHSFQLKMNVIQKCKSALPVGSLAA